MVVRVVSPAEPPPACSTGRLAGPGRDLRRHRPAEAATDGLRVELGAAARAFAGSTGTRPGICRSPRQAPRSKLRGVVLSRPVPSRCRATGRSYRSLYWRRFGWQVGVEQAEQLLHNPPQEKAFCWRLCAGCSSRSTVQSAVVDFPSAPSSDFVVRWDISTGIVSKCHAVGEDLSEPGI